MPPRVPRVADRPNIEYRHICMVRENLADLPQHSLPAGYTARPFAPGDRATWLRIWRASETFETIRPSHFDESFGDDPGAMIRRAMFLVSPAGKDVGTITAWYEKRYLRRPWGRIHWVAVLPNHRGRGLSRGMMTLAMNRLWALGHRRAMLATQTTRIPAIRTYLRFGFVPALTDAGSADAWRLVAGHVDHPALKGL